MTRMTCRRLHAYGFSLVELLVSVAILGLLASVAMPVVEYTQRRQKEVELRIALHDIRRAIDAYKDAAAGHRIFVKEGASGYPPSLVDLTAGVKDLSSPDGPLLYFMRRVPRDPMNADPSVSAVDSWRKRSYSSPPDAPHEGDDVYDVYSQSPDNGLNGVPYAEW